MVSQIVDNSKHGTQRGLVVQALAGSAGLCKKYFMFVTKTADMSRGQLSVQTDTDRALCCFSFEHTRVGVEWCGRSTGGLSISGTEVEKVPDVGGEQLPP